jgi:hypothetical protein
VHIGRGGETSPVQWQLVSESLRAWADEQHARPSGLGATVTFLATREAIEPRSPDCDFAVPLT